MVRTPTAQTIVAAAHLPLRAIGDFALEQVCEHIVDAGLAGARWVIFPEGCLPGYPAWVWALHSGIDLLLDTLRAAVLDNAIHIPSDTTDRLCSIAERAQVNVAIGVIERKDAEDGIIFYNTLLFIDAQGRMIGRYRTFLVSVSAQWTWAPTKTAMPVDESSTLSRIGGI